MRSVRASTGMRAALTGLALSLTAAGTLQAHEQDGYTGGGIIHILLASAIIFVPIHIIQGQGRVE